MSNKEEKNINNQLKKMKKEIKEIKNYLKLTNNNPTVNSSNWGNLPMSVNSSSWGNIQMSNNESNNPSKIIGMNRHNELNRQAELNNISINKTPRNNNLLVMKENSPYNNKKTYKTLKEGNSFNYHSSSDGKNYKNEIVAEIHPTGRNSKGTLIRTKNKGDTRGRTIPQKNLYSIKIKKSK